MIFATADLHGTALEGFMALLRRAGFSSADELYVLGDVIDRGEDGVRLLRFMASQDNIHLIMGNHEAMMLSCRFLFEEVTQAGVDALTPDMLAAYAAWRQNGAAPTLRALRALHQQSPAALFDLFDYVADAPLAETVCAGGRDFLLVHAGLGGFQKGRRLSSYTQEELLFHRPSPGERYSDRAMTILGHTPTQAFGEAHRGRMFAADTWIDIDTGAGCGGKPMLLRLDDLTPFYMD